MPKMKTKKAAKKRFSITGTGKLVHARTGKQHINGYMTAKKIRKLRHGTTTSSANEKQTKRMLPYL